MALFFPSPSMRGVVLEQVQNCGKGTGTQRVQKLE